jgi:hypothetical protein
MATENCLWGAPRIHGELLKLGFTVSERTVSRYLPDRLTRRSQTWRTFLANHIGSLAFASTVTSSFVTSDDDVDAFVLRCRPVLPSRDGRYASAQGPLVDWPPSLQWTSLGWCVAQDQLPRRTRTRFSSGKDPPKWDVEPVLVAYGWRLLTSRDPSRACCRAPETHLLRNEDFLSVISAMSSSLLTVVAVVILACLFESS